MPPLLSRSWGGDAGFTQLAAPSACVRPARFPSAARAQLAAISAAPALLAPLPLASAAFQAGSAASNTSGAFGRCLCLCSPSGGLAGCAGVAVLGGHLQESAVVIALSKDPWCHCPLAWHRGADPKHFLLTSRCSWMSVSLAVSMEGRSIVRGALGMLLGTPQLLLLKGSPAYWKVLYHCLLSTLLHPGSPSAILSSSLSGSALWMLGLLHHHILGWIQLLGWPILLLGIFHWCKQFLDLDTDAHCHKILEENMCSISS